MWVKEKGVLKDDIMGGCLELLLLNLLELLQIHKLFGRNFLDQNPQLQP